MAIDDCVAKVTRAIQAEGGSCETVRVNSFDALVMVEGVFPVVVWDSPRALSPARARRIVQCARLKAARGPDA